MIVRVVVAVLRWLKRTFRPDDPPARGGGPALDRALDEDELRIEAAERGLTGRDREDWIEERPFRISDVLYPNGSPYGR